jgi:uncharacterized membrane protein YfcA
LFISNYPGTFVVPDSSMPFSLAQIAAVSLVLFASSVVQGAVGFAAGLFGIPLLVLSGISFPDAVAITLVAAAPQNIIPAWQLRREIDFRRALRPMLIRFAFLPLGVFALYLIGHERKDAASQLVGVIVLAIVAVQRAWHVEPQRHLHPAWEWVAFGLGGFLLGLCGMGGPPMVLWVLAHDWPMNRGRAFLFFIFATGLIPQAFLLWLFFGDAMFHAMLLGALALPPVLVGLWCGLYVSRLVSDQMLRRISVALLLLVAASAIIMPLMRFTTRRPEPPPAVGSHAASSREFDLIANVFLKLRREPGR